MVHILGVALKDHHLARFALTKFFGVGPKVSERLCARFQIHNQCKVRELSPFQVTSLASFLSSPATAPALPRLPLASPGYTPPPSNTPTSELHEQLRAAQTIAANKATQGKGRLDPLKKLKIDSELRREIRENIAHQRMIGSYVGRRHAMHLPVRGQNTQSNAKNAKKFNRLDRY